MFTVAIYFDSKQDQCFVKGGHFEANQTIRLQNQFTWVSALSQVGIEEYLSDANTRPWTKVQCPQNY